MTTSGIEHAFQRLSDHKWKQKQTSASIRIEKLKGLKNVVLSHEAEIVQALLSDFKKPPAETQLSEIGPVLSEIDHFINHLREWMKPTKVPTPMTLLGTVSHIQHEAKGAVLILAPWNYPFQLALCPLIAAYAAGNTAGVKPSEKTTHTTAVLQKIISHAFSPDEVFVFEGDATVAQKLTTLQWDHIFFTGSTPVGRKVMQAASQNLIPVTLELGGKSPVIIDESANLKEAAERIVWAKWINAGQTCIAPDYILVQENVKGQWLNEVRNCLKTYPDFKTINTSGQSEYCQVIDEPNFKRLESALAEAIKEGAHVEAGGRIDALHRRIEPTVLSNVKPNLQVLQDEIFGPLLPVMSFKNIGEAILLIQKNPKPLSLYIFSKTKATIQKILNETSSGGAVVNHLLLHFTNHNLPFGGVGQSGVGNYHGYFGFKTFSHEKAVLLQKLKSPVTLFKPPYDNKWVKLINRFMR